MFDDIQQKLDALYIELADTSPNSPKFNSLLGDICKFNALLEDIGQLEKFLPKTSEQYAEPELINYCGSPSCNGSYCWECAAIRGGCPEDV